MYRYAVTEDAELDLEDLEDYVLSYSDPDFADELFEEFKHAFERLCDNPYIHPVYQFEPPMPTLHEYRSVNVYNFKVFYWIDETHDLVVVYRILHQVADFSRLHA